MCPAIVEPTTPRVQSVHAQLFSQQPWLVHAFSTRTGGASTAYGRHDDLNLGFTPHDERASVLENRRRFLESVGGAGSMNSFSPALVLAKQIHSACFVRVDSASLPPTTEADGLMTNQPGLLLGVQTADCVPVLVADPVTRSVAGFHAGWRGTVQRIVEQGIVGMSGEFGSDPGDLLAAIGPSIGQCCYVVGEEVDAAFRREFSYAQELLTPDMGLDLKEANRRQLVEAGLDPESICVIPDCTGCQPELYFSHRAQKGVTGRMLSVIGLRAGA